MIHGNIRRGALFVTKSGELKISGFELAAGSNDADLFFTNPTRYLKGGNIQDWPSEMIGATVQRIKSYPTHTVDSWMLAKFIDSLHSDALPPPLQSWSQDVLRSDPSRRHSASLLLEPSIRSRTFASPLISVDNLVSSLSATDEVERDRAFVSIQQFLGKIPESYLEYKLIPAVLLLLQIKPSLEGIRLVLRCIPLLSDDQVFTNSISPFIVWLFSLPDRAIRLLLLDAFDFLNERLEEKTIQDSIFGHFCTGFVDSLPEIREKTLKCSVSMASKLSGRQLNIDLVRHYTRLQTDEQPGIRVNAIICFGKLATLIEEAGRQKVLVAAIGRALQDPFPPSRSAAIMALMATVSVVSDEALARNILPQLCSSLVDREASISGQAFAAMRHILDRLEAHQAEARKSQPEEPKESKTTSPSIAKKASDWGNWGLGAITDQVSKLQTRLVSSKEPSQPTSPAVADLPPRDSGNRMKLTRKKSLELEQEPPKVTIVEQKEEESFPSIQGLNLHDGWLEQDDFDPWSAAK